MRCCLTCGITQCLNSGMDTWIDECPFFPPEEMSDEERKNFEEWEQEEEEGGEA